MDKLKENAQNIIGMRLVTPQTSAEGKLVNAVLVAEDVYYPSAFALFVGLADAASPVHVGVGAAPSSPESVGRAEEEVSIVRSEQTTSEAADEAAAVELAVALAAPPSGSEEPQAARARLEVSASALRARV